jgi:ADP-ribosyl-[dinitrogen reductase] hydrolase
LRCSARSVSGTSPTGARHSSPEFAVVSLYRVGEPFPHPVHRIAFLADNDSNTEIHAVLSDVLADVEALRAESRQVLVHCQGGASRTGLVLRAWPMRTQGLSPAEATTAVADRWPYLGLWNDSFTEALERLR